MKEIWKRSPLLPLHFEVSNLGGARTLTRHIPTKTGKLRTFLGKTLKPAKCTNGYLFIHYWEPERKLHKGVLMHRAIAAAFIPNPQNKPQVNHKDGNRQNNIASNLEWMNCSENHFHKSRVLGQNRGILNPAAKLNQQQVEIIKARLVMGESIGILSKDFKVSRGTIWDIKAGKTWRHLGPDTRSDQRKQVNPR